MFKFLPVIMYSAISLAIYQGVFFPLFDIALKKDNVDPDEITKRCTLAGVGLGVGETIGALGNGRLQDMLGFKKIIYVYLVEVVVAFAMIIAYTVNNEWSFWLAFCMQVAWGIQDAAANNFVWCVCGFQFESKTRPFMLFFFVQSFSTFILLYIESFIKTQLAFLIYFSVCIVFGLFAWLLFFFTFDLK